LYGYFCQNGWPTFLFNLTKSKIMNNTFFTNSLRSSMSTILMTGILLFTAVSCGDPKDPEEIRVERVELNKPTTTLAIDGTETFTATVFPENASNKEITWKSGDDAIASVAGGVVTAHSIGQTTITVTTVDGGKTTDCVVIVEEDNDDGLVHSITLDSHMLTFMEGDEPITLTAEILPSSATNQIIEWESSDTNIATVENGVVTPIALGSATITAKATDGSDVSAAAQARVTYFGPSFHTEQEWAIGNLVWSDEVMARRCRGKDTYDGGQYVNEYKVDCYENGMDAATGVIFGDLFSWAAVDQYKDELCPAPWRVPTAEDFIALNIALGGKGGDTVGADIDGNPVQWEIDLWHAYQDVWGARPGGYVVYMLWNNTIQLDGQGNRGCYWSQSVLSVDTNRAFYTYIAPAVGWVQPNFNEDKGAGFTLRCVKDK
jgi:uncharacterized protein (TIGR02145 family)